LGKNGSNLPPFDDVFFKIQNFFIIQFIENGTFSPIFANILTPTKETSKKFKISQNSLP
jgi:hypothetical protein